MAEIKRFYVQNVDDWKNTLTRKKFSDRELTIKVVEHGIILPAHNFDGE